MIYLLIFVALVVAFWLVRPRPAFLHWFRSAVATRAEQSIVAATPPAVALGTAESAIATLEARLPGLRRERQLALGRVGTWSEVAKRAAFYGRAPECRGACARVVDARALIAALDMEIGDIEGAAAELRTGAIPLRRAVTHDEIARAREAVGIGKEAAKAAEYRRDLADARANFYGDVELHTEERQRAIDAEVESVRESLTVRGLPPARAS